MPGNGTGTRPWFASFPRPWYRIAHRPHGRSATASGWFCYSSNASGTGAMPVGQDTPVPPSPQ